MAEYREILYEVEDGVATVTLHRPEKLNAWTLRMGAEVRHALWSAERDDAVRAVVVTGAGRAYCAGADMDLLRSLGSGEGAEPLPEDLRVPEDPSSPPVFRGEYSYPLGMTKPVLAAVNGVAAGLGFSYMLYYDIRIASERARFGALFARRGLVAEHGTAWLLPRLVGLGNACEILFSGRWVEAEEARRLGLVQAVVPHDELLPYVRNYARELATECSPRSLRIMKRQLYGALFQDLGEAMREADREMVASFSSEDFREGVLAFLEKRPPRFRGR
ncbi:MAG: enoyl-CoA hydratase [Candidatus Binatia bacterium]|nr:MAG: enoyl-CoA hydratase [Candidatus Binatia bacterium]